MTACVLLRVNHADQLLEKTQRAGRLAREAFAGHCLDLSYEAGKTEAVCTPIGKGAKKVMSVLARPSPLQLAFFPDEGSVRVLRLVRDYRHLGSLVDAGGGLGPEIGRRLGEAKSSAKPLYKHVFGNADVDIHERRILFRSLALSRALHNVGAWAGLSKHELRCWQQGIFGLYRFLVPARVLRDSPNITHAQLLRRVGLPAPVTLLRIERLKMLAQLLSTDSAMVWSVLESDLGSCRCWFSDVWCDVLWVVSHVPRHGLGLHSASEKLAGLQELGRHPASLRRLVKRLWLRASWGQAERDVVQVQHNMHGDEELRDCSLCGHACRGKRGLAAHLSLQHKVLSLPKFYLTSTVCPCCALDFHSRKRALKHLSRGSPTCLQWVQRFIQPLTIARIRQLDGAKARRSWRTFRPAETAHPIIDLAELDPEDIVLPNTLSDFM